MHFSKIIKIQESSKIPSNVWPLFAHIEALLSLNHELVNYPNPLPARKRDVQDDKVSLSQHVRTGGFTKCSNLMECLLKQVFQSCLLDTGSL